MAQVSMMADRSDTAGVPTIVSGLSNFVKEAKDAEQDFGSILQSSFEG